MNARERLNCLEDDLLSTVSHELRTPLTIMRMAIQMLKLVKDLQQQEQYLKILETECMRMAELINNLLDLEQMEALALASGQKLVEQLGGTILVESSSGWTTFTIQLPNGIKRTRLSLQGAFQDIYDKLLQEDSSCN